MKKRKTDEIAESHVDIGSPHKKSKHKHKKHKKKRERSSSNSEEIDVVGFDMKKDTGHGFGPLKLKIKFGGETVSTAQFVNIPGKDKAQSTSQIPPHKGIAPIAAKSEVKQVDDASVEDNNDENNDDDDNDDDDEDEDEDEDDDDDDDDDEFGEAEESEEILVSNNGDSSHQGLDFDDFRDDVTESDVVSQDATHHGEEDEESKWLDALESGELDDFGRLKKEKDVSLMTARQRALYGHLVEGETELLELPLWAKRRDENSEEAQLRRKQRAKKRKQQMQKQVEETKAQTIDKLLNKQATKGKKDQKAANRWRKQENHIKYANGQNGISISMSKGIEFPLKPQAARPTPAAVQCSVDGCNNPKKYACSKTNLPVCGLECYKTVQKLNPTIAATI